MANAIQKISERAKQLYKNGKAGRSWKTCIKMASSEYRGGKLGKTKSYKKKKAVKKKANYRQTGKSVRKSDMERSARPPGARIPKGGRKVTYYERRKNRSDVPGQLTGTALNEMVLRNISERNRSLQDAESRLIRLKKLEKETPRGMARNLVKSRVRDMKKYIKTLRGEIRMLKTNIK